MVGFNYADKNDAKHMETRLRRILKKVNGRKRKAEVRSSGLSAASPRGGPPVSDMIHDMLG